MKLASGHEAAILEGEEREEMNKHWEGYGKGLVRLTPGRWLLPAPFLNFADKYYSFKVRVSTDYYEVPL